MKITRKCGKIGNEKEEEKMIRQTRKSEKIAFSEGLWGGERGSRTGKTRGELVHIHHFGN